MYLGVPAFSQPWHSCGTAPARTLHPVPSHPVLTIPSRQVTIPSHPIPSHPVWKGAAACLGRNTHLSGCDNPCPGVALLRHGSGSHIPSHLIPSHPIPSRQVTIPYHTIPSHTIPSSVEGCRSLPRQGHICTWLCQPSPRRGAPVARLRRAQYIPSHLIPSRPIPSRQVTIPYHTIPYHLTSSSV